MQKGSKQKMDVRRLYPANIFIQTTNSTLGNLALSWTVFFAVVLLTNEDQADLFQKKLYWLVLGTDRLLRRREGRTGGRWFSGKKREVQFVPP
jgi:ABC-type uncharacterized transport system involved in gliding motility auxiliary subunit